MYDKKISYYNYNYKTIKRVFEANLLGFREIIIEFRYLKIFYLLIHNKIYKKTTRNLAISDNIYEALNEENNQ